MPDQAPNEAFSQALSTLYPDFQISRNFGASNSLLARTDLQRIYFAGPNLNNFHKSSRPGLVIACVARFATETDVYLGLLVKKDVDVVRERLKKMIALGKAGDSSYAESNNNGRFMFSQKDKRFYLFNAESWTDIDFDDPDSQPSFDIDCVQYAVYPPGRASFQSLAAGEFIRFLIKNLGRDRVQEIAVWQDEDILITPSMQRDPTSVPLNEIEENIRDQGYYYSAGLIPQLHAGFNHLPHKHFVILTGLSGTGKTSLVKAYARAVHGIESTETSDPLFFLCPVRPEWTDPTGLSGYYDVISGQYIVPPFLEAVFTAYSHPSSPVFVCLDELNLARVEYYFSDFLSVIELQERLILHSHDISLDGSNGVPVPPAIRMPHNLYIAGTINIDETTNPLSDKVLDRSVVIDVSQVDLNEFFSILVQKDPDLDKSIRACRQHLLWLHEQLRPHHLAFGYRVAEEFVRYVRAAEAIGQMNTAAAIDSQIAQKILVKLRGDSQQRQLLVTLDNYFGKQEWGNSRQGILPLLDELDKFGSFEYAR